MVGILVQIKGASCVAFVCVKSGKVVSSTLIINWRLREEWLG